MRRINRELDIVYFLRKCFEMREIIKALSSKSARSLARMQSSLIVDDNKASQPSESESASDFDVLACIPETNLEHELLNKIKKKCDNWLV